MVRSKGGMAQRQTLLALGARGTDLTAAVRRAEVIRVRNGWYSTFDENDPRLRAVRVGGRLTGISACAARGAWLLGEHPLHVSMADNAARMRTQQNRWVRLDVAATRGVVLHWDDAAVARSGSVTEVALVDALYRVVLDEDFEVAVAVLDWALHTGLVDVVAFEELILRLPANRQGIGRWADANCESLPESLTRTRLRVAGHEVQSQVRLGDFQRIDLVVDGLIGIEVDGELFHRDRFEPDREKDIDITLGHLHAIRPSARAVFHRWSKVQSAVETALADRGFRGQNSGLGVPHPRLDPALAGWRRRSTRPSPEF